MNKVSTLAANGNGENIPTVICICHTSESAFSRAFKSWHQLSPLQWRRSEENI
jgi:hypothetical protein